MLLKAIALLPLTALAAQAATIGSTASQAPITGYSVYVPEWEVQAFPGGEIQIIGGTVEQVLDELRKINPNYDEDFGIGNVTESGLTDVVGPKADFEGAATVCDGWELANTARIREGISHLDGIDGKPHRGAGPASCGRVSCSYNSAIWWCNDDTKAKELNSFREISDGALYVIKKCRVGESTRVAGQAFHKDNWNVIVRWARC
ncbi:hypothetical protein CGMCC3_g16073 [Colletotrichum fructicola]|uniref:Secreted protein n=1 Tax=Colletotrichum fructicola (strain Nara gc5) TaxID=1213859 RepID=A0A7J6IM28_COLFN|nr:uncharacterized protein CGMCC3_g16073 [Colletotrichum fructicola]KAE9567778.1 hypothetical protein CGMCC3_g16073 [Colletotrichum fructicola]KAF4412148.1 hypothetical protein CFRS1_v001588 [Colletotrichum fructicola]KAF4477829.1 hypothetical protein CGGC5_v013948 [Colletotrichum fructicola Nara gc5]KAF5493855.1 hypothetical protein CGCF413_v009563 [Colletotrichum fructicola]